MDPFPAIIAFSLAAGLLTITPGLDTALVLRTLAVEGGRSALLAGMGISAGSVCWGIATAVGLAALLAVSEIAYLALKIAGALYLVWLGAGMLRNAVRATVNDHQAGEPAIASVVSGRNWFLRGMATNLLNPKVGVFYVTFLPQFIPAGASVGLYSVGLASLHAAMGLAWFAFLIHATRPLSRFLSKPMAVRALEGSTGGILILFGARLALERR